MIIPDTRAADVRLKDDSINNINNEHISTALAAIAMNGCHRMCNNIMIPIVICSNMARYYQPLAAHNKKQKWVNQGAMIVVVTVSGI